MNAAARSFDDVLRLVESLFEAVSQSPISRTAKYEEELRQVRWCLQPRRPTARPS